MKNYTMQLKLRYAFLTIAAVNLLIIGMQLLRYPSLLKVSGSLPYIVEPVILLIVYIGIIVWMTKKTDVTRNTVLRIGTAIGLLCGGLEVLHLIQENFLHFGGNIDGIVNLGFMLGVFLLWGVPSYLVVRTTGSLKQGILSSMWSAIVTILIAVLFGFIQEFYIHTPPPSQVATWAEFIRSGWKDIPAFTIANTLDSASTHLLMGSIVASVFGVIGGTLEKLFTQREKSK